MKTFGGYEIVDEKARENIENIKTDKIILVSPNGTEYKITISDDGVLTSTKIDNETEVIDYE